MEYSGTYATLTSDGLLQLNPSYGSSRHTVVSNRAGAALSATTHNLGVSASNMLPAERTYIVSQAPYAFNVSPAQEVQTVQLAGLQQHAMAVSPQYMLQQAPQQLHTSVNGMSSMYAPAGYRIAHASPAAPTNGVWGNRVYVQQGVAAPVMSRPAGMGNVTTGISVPSGYKLVQVPVTSGLVSANVQPRNVTTVMQQEQPRYLITQPAGTAMVQPACVVSAAPTQTGTVRGSVQEKSFQQGLRISNVPLSGYNTHVSHAIQAAHNTVGVPGSGLAMWNDDTQESSVPPASSLVQAPIVPASFQAPTIASMTSHYMSEHGELVSVAPSTPGSQVMGVMAPNVVTDDGHVQQLQVSAMHTEKPGDAFVQAPMRASQDALVSPFDTNTPFDTSTMNGNQSIAAVRERDNRFVGNPLLSIAIPMDNASHPNNDLLLECLGKRFAQLDVSVDAALQSGLLGPLTSDQVFKLTKAHEKEQLLLAKGAIPGAPATDDGSNGEEMNCSSASSCASRLEVLSLESGMSTEMDVRANTSTGLLSDPATDGEAFNAFNYDFFSGVETAAANLLECLEANANISREGGDSVAFSDEVDS